MFRRYGAFAGLFIAAKELRRAPSFEVELDIGSSCCLLQSLASRASLGTHVPTGWRFAMGNVSQHRGFESVSGNVSSACVGRHLRQHERLTKADRELEERIRTYALKEPMVRHLIYAAPH